MNIIPTLDCRLDSLSCDYPEGMYGCTMISLRGGSAISARHDLSGAPDLDRLIIDGMASYAVEIVSSDTFTSSLTCAANGASNHEFNIDNATISLDGAQARPGIIAVHDCELATARLNGAWSDLGASVAVHAGQWLARGQHHNLASPKSSLLRFIGDDTVKSRELRCAYSHPIYQISMNHKDLKKCQQEPDHPTAKTILLAAFVAALADANGRPAFTGVHEDGSEDQREAIGDQLAAQLKALDLECPTPGDDNYDPLRAASLLLGEDMIIFDLDGDVSW